MSNAIPVIFACTALFILNACSTFTAPLSIAPGETLEVGGDQSGPFGITTLNEGATDVVVTCDKADFESPVTLGPSGQSTRKVASKGSALLTNTSDDDTAQLKVTIVSYRPQTVGIQQSSTQ